MSKLRIACLALLAVGAAALPSTANAWWRGGVYFGIAPFPFFVPPPVYYAPPPVVYAPPPVVYAPPQATAAAASCSAGAYICPLDRPLPVGSACSCPTNRGRIGGYVR